MSAAAIPQAPPSALPKAVRLPPSPDARNDDVVARSDEDAKPSLFQRAWSCVTAKNIARALVVGLAGGAYAALWLFAPPIAMAVTIAAATAAGGALLKKIGELCDKLFGTLMFSNPAPQPQVINNYHYHIYHQPNQANLENPAQPVPNACFIPFPQLGVPQQA